MKYGDSKLNLLSDHIGTFGRSVPVQRWSAIAWLMLGLVLLATGAWELKMRSLGLRTADIDDGKDYWAVERRKVESGPRDQIVIVGDSRILLDTNLDEWQRLSGIRPIQLALAGIPARPYLHDMAEDEHFAGLLVLGIAEGSFFLDLAPLYDALNYVHSESPSQRVGHRIDLVLQKRLAFLDSDHALFALLDSLGFPNRPGLGFGGWRVRYGAMKLSEAYADRQTVMWSRVEADPSSWIRAWDSVLTAFPAQALPDFMIQKGIAGAKQDIDKIRSRGGEVVIVRPPSSGSFLKMENIMTPRDKVWDPLVRETHSLGIYYDDYPEMRGLNVVEYSHLSGDSALKFTRAYVSVLCEKVPWLRAHGVRCVADTQRQLAGS